MDHTTFNNRHTDEKDLHDTVLAHPFLRRHICKLSEQLGYPQRPQCAPPKAPRTTDREKGRQRSKQLLKNSPLGRHSHLTARYETDDAHGLFH
jgi:hypothetical protein